jgi:hypothetical protein
MSFVAKQPQSLAAAADPLGVVTSAPAIPHLPMSAATSAYFFGICRAVNATAALSEC